jgi:hypothetical protein
VTSKEEWQARSDERQARRAEVQRLLAVGGASLPKLRLLTVICANDHNLVKVYRISGVLIWEGSHVRRDMTWLDGELRRSPPRRRRVFDLLGDCAPLQGEGRPAGTCPCGRFGLSPGWLAEQMDRKDLPANRRVIHELPPPEVR